MAVRRYALVGCGARRLGMYARPLVRVGPAGDDRGVASDRTLVGKAV